MRRAAIERLPNRRTESSSSDVSSSQDACDPLRGCANVDVLAVDMDCGSDSLLAAGVAALAASA